MGLTTDQATLEAAYAEHADRELDDLITSLAAHGMVRLEARLAAERIMDEFDNQASGGVAP